MTRFFPASLPCAATAAVLCLCVALVHAGGRDRKWQEVAAMIGPNDAVAVYGPAGERVFSKNEEKPLIPASTLKLLTALAAFHYLGEDYRFPTEFYVNAQNDLIIKGYGDPLLVSEEAGRIARILAGRLCRVRRILLDDTYFETPLVIPGTRPGSRQPYDAPVGALCVNFNTVFFKKTDSGYASAEPQTPLLPIARKKISRCRADSGRILLSRRNDENLAYAGQLFAHFLSAHGVETGEQVRPGRAEPEVHRLVYRHESTFPLTAVVERLMRYSNNFIANQLLLATGARVYGAPGTLEKGLHAAGAYARDVLGIDPKIVEGSGISRQNRMSARMFVPVLDAFAPWFRLLPGKNGIYRKTGTLDGIETRAGYVEAGGKLFRFAVLINSAGRPADPVLAKIASIVRRPD